MNSNVSTAVNATLFRPKGRVFTAAVLPGAAIDLAFAKQKARIDFTDDDTLVEAYLIAATSAVEKYLNQVIIERECVLRLPRLPAGFQPIELPGGNVSAITSVVVDGETLEPTTYDVLGNNPAQLVPTQAWETAEGDLLPVVITYTAGFAPSDDDFGANVPAVYRVAVAMAVAEMYEPGTQAGEGTATVLPAYAERLLAPYRLLSIPSDDLPRGGY